MRLPGVNEHLPDEDEYDDTVSAKNFFDDNNDLVDDDVSINVDKYGIMEEDKPSPNSGMVEVSQTWAIPSTQIPSVIWRSLPLVNMANTALNMLEGLVSVATKVSMQMAPCMRMTMDSLRSFMLIDNRPVTYIQQLDKVIDLKPAIIMIVIPSDKGKHYASVERMLIEQTIILQGRVGRRRLL